MKKVLVDTSVWIAHLKEPQEKLVGLLKDDAIVTHSHIIGEIACGHIKERERFLRDLLMLPKCSEATFIEVLNTISRYKWAGKGTGWVDANLLTSAMLSDLVIYSLDRNLNSVAKAQGLRVVAT